MALKVCETFYSLMGESTRAGLPAFFIRLTGCNLRCNYCDTAYAYEEGREAAAALLALRGVDDTVKKLAAFDLAHTRTELINRVFRGFPGLLKLLPSLPNDPGTAFFDGKQWPTDQAKKQDERMLAPSPELLRECSRVQDQLAPVDAKRWTLIAGVNQKTVTQASYDRERDEVQYEFTNEGDGTVPLRFARVPDMPEYFVEESHGSLQNNAVVRRAVVDILAKGITTALPAQRPAVPWRR